MMGLETYLSKVSVSKTLEELIKISASQINGCVYCINMHTKDALKTARSTNVYFGILARAAPATMGQSRDIVYFLTFNREARIFGRANHKTDLK